MIDKSLCIHSALFIESKFQYVNEKLVKTLYNYGYYNVSLLKVTYRWLDRLTSHDLQWYITLNYIRLIFYQICSDVIKTCSEYNTLIYRTRIQQLYLQVLTFNLNFFHKCFANEMGIQVIYRRIGKKYVHLLLSHRVTRNIIIILISYT